VELPKKYISYSQIRLYQSCPLKYYYTYVKKLPAPVNDKIYLGIVVHAAIEFYLQEKIEGRLPHRDRVIEYFENEFGKRQKGMNLVWGNSPEETQKRGLAFVGYFMREIAHTVKPLMVEKELLAELPGIGVQLKGVIDLVEEDFSITDFKTTTAKWSKTRIKSSYLQVVIYRYLFEKAFGDVISQLKFKIIYAKKPSNIRHQEIVVNPKDVDYDYNKMFDIIKYVVDGIKGEAFYKNESYGCGFCEFKDICGSDSNREPGAS
jgi:CRISPR/Cas system-associated exonuclease Cas4 (RecB family)